MPYIEGDKWRAKVVVAGQRYTALKRTKQEAKDWETDKRRALGQNVEQSSESLGLGEFCVEYAIYCKRFSAKTQQEKKALSRRLITEWGKATLIHNITPRMVVQYLGQQGVRRTRNAANKDRKNLLALFGWGVRFGYCGSNPAARTEKLPHDREP